MSIYREHSFQQEIEALTQQSNKNHAYPRPDLIDLERYLKTPTPPRSQNGAADSASPSTDVDATSDFALVHELSTGASSSFESSWAGLDKFIGHRVSREPSILFLRGYPSPEWITTAGEKYKVNPELFRRHLQHKAFTLGSRELYLSSSMPSSSAHVFQLTIPTICTRNVGSSGWEPEDLQEERQNESEGMGRYFKQLRAKAKVGDSVVRNSLLLSRQEYALEQKISIEVGPPRDNWRIIVWLDSGRDLSQSVEGPWSPRPGARAWETYFFPVIVQQAPDTSRPHLDAVSSLHPNTFTSSRSIRSHASNDYSAEEWKAAQNIGYLPFQYGSRLDRELASHDALYALSELFQFVASAESQFLNLLAARIEHELSFIGGDNVMRYHHVSLLNLKFIKTQLTAHAQGLNETITILRNRHSLDWPRADHLEKYPIVEHTAVLLLADFEYLLHRAQTLARECETGMSTLANSAVLEESRRSHQTALQVQKLTVIATIFIPLSFVCSIWGMNFVELGTGSQPLWKWFVSAAPVLLFSWVAYRWDELMRLRKRVMSKGRRNPSGLV